MAKGGLAALTAKSKQHDPVLGALFSSSIGPTSRPDASRYNKGKIEAGKKNSKRAEADSDDQDDDLSSVEEELDDEDDEEEGDEDDDDGDEDDGGLESEEDQDQALTESDSGSGDEDAQEVVGDSAIEIDDAQAMEKVPELKKTRKRKRRDETDDLEGRYLMQLAREEEAEEAFRKKQRNSKGPEPNEAQDLAEGSSPGADGGDDSDDDATPVHESLDTSASGNTDVEKANRTVFLSNISITAATSNSDKRALLAHLSSILDTSSEPTEKLESIRFRSLPISDTALPKRAAYIKGSLMDSTTHSANAYVVYSTTAAARRAVSKLNGTKVLDRHLRVDSVTHPSPTDHHRCVFVGNLVYMDDETITTKNGNGEMVAKKRSKKPADVEEGLWRMFGQEGRRVENVRVPRDPKTRVGKGFAYVQFYHQNDVETALLLNGKKYPPMLPRPLRVTRAKPPHRTALAMERTQAKKTGISGKRPRDGKYVPKVSHEQRSLDGRAAKLFGRSAVTRPKFGKAGKRDGPANLKSPETTVAEGRRASAKDGLPSGMKLGRPQRAKGAGRKAALKSRGGKRAAEWRKSKAQ